MLNQLRISQATCKNLFLSSVILENLTSSRRERWTAQVLSAEVLLLVSKLGHCV